MAIRISGRHLFEYSLFLHKWIAKKYGRFIRVDTVGTKDRDTRIAVLELMSREIIRYKIDGAAAELGVYQGGFAKQINHFFPDKKLYLFDTFEGFDERDTSFDIKSGLRTRTPSDFSQTSEELVLSAMEHPENCIVRKGWFPDTAEGIDDTFCFVSLDADLYQPIIAGLKFFYPRLLHGGVIMIHDFNNSEYGGARKAVKEFCDDNRIGYVCIHDSCGSAVIVK